MSIERLRGAAALVWLALASATTAGGFDYRVGPGRAHADPSAVPWESLEPGDRVLIDWRVTPYRDKWVLAVRGTPTQPIVVRGIPGPGGALPVIDGSQAKTRLALDYWNEERSVIKIGGASVPDQADPAHLVVEQLEIRGGRAGNTFENDGGATRDYADNAAGIFIERGEGIVIRNCRLVDNGNGLFVANGGRDVALEGSHLTANGNPGSLFEHNAYTEADGMRYQANRFGPLAEGALGNNLKDRSTGLVVRYNWIEGGNRQLDLVDSSTFATDPDYRSTFVYGNVLIENEGDGNSQIVHYGGDSGSPAQYRKGTLFFYHNTILSRRTGNTTLLRLSTNDEHADARNNVVHLLAAAGTRLRLVDRDGSLDLRDSWLPTGFVESHSGEPAIVALTRITTGPDPQIDQTSGARPAPLDGSPTIDAAGPLASTLPVEHLPTSEYVLHQSAVMRPQWGVADLGAFEARPSVPGIGALAAPVAIGLAWCLAAYSRRSRDRGRRRSRDGR